MTTNGVAYLLLHVGVPTHIVPRSLRHILEANRAARSMGVRLLRVPTVSRATPNQRYVFTFPSGRSDNKTAVRIAECVLYGLELSFGPFGDPDVPDPVYQFPVALLARKRPLDLGTLIKHEEALPHASRSLDYPGLALRSVSYVADDAIAAAWRASRILFCHARLREAARFLKASQGAFFVWPGQIDEVLSNTLVTPAHGAQQTAVEDALINTFKVIEAVIGDPPKDDRKFAAKIRAIGADPDEPMGYHAPKPLIQFIRDINVARDRKAAHGSTQNRVVTITDMFEYQLCARYLLVLAIEAELGEPLFRTPRARRRRPKGS